MKEKKKFTTRHRLYVLSGLLAAVMVLFVSVLLVTQMVHGRDYRARSLTSNAISRTVEASRGILTDRNGKVLVSNRLVYTLKLDKSAFGEDEALDEAALNETILYLVELCLETGTDWSDDLPLTTDTAPLLYRANRYEADFLEFLDKSEITHNLSPAELLSQLRLLFHIDSSYTTAQARYIAGVRYALYDRNSYVFSEDVPTEMIAQLVDSRLPGVTTEQSSTRVYNTPYAAHILGRITRIYREDWETYRDKGYSMDALVGESGAEKAFEDYLRGFDGQQLITTDANGKITGTIDTVPARPGGTVALTLDIDLQEAAEKALATTIESMIDGDSAQRGGAAAVVKIGTGEVLALASYPTYNLSTFGEDYESLLSDERLPMFNRATDGTYAPGSTFKMCTAVAALENGIITPTSEIRDEGVYTYYEYPQPHCWVWPLGYTHERVNVSEAITDSCNYFFFEVGRLTGIQSLNDYAAQFGLGAPTGIEIGESNGVLASKEYAESRELEWSEGQVITAAIGQSYHLFTPLQLANYTATLVGGGERYSTHLLKSVKSYDNTELLYVYDEPPVNTVSMSPETLDAVTEGMHALTTGSLAGAFEKCIVTAGAKTGSAQVGTDIANGVFVCYAPYEDPEIAVAIVIEKGGAGAALADTAVEIINAYFSHQLSGGEVSGENVLLK